MRLLHTSDWHIGRTFHGRDRLPEQERVLTGLAELVADEGVDVVVVAGDLYDRAVPSGEAVEVCHRVLAALRAAGATLVVIPGNHDSASRLGAFADFAAVGGLHVLARISRLHEPVVLTDAHGPVACFGIPYLDPDPARHHLGLAGTGHRGHTAVLSEAMDRVRGAVARLPPSTRTVVLAHAFVTGGQASESERPISVGGVEQVPGSVFDGVDYVALGHLHGPQVLADHLRYSGSPLAYSFSETAHRKSVWIVDLDADGLAGVRSYALPVPRALATISGGIEDLLADPGLHDLEEHYLSVTLTDRVRPLDAMRRLQRRFPHAVHLEWRPEGGLARSRLNYSSAVRGRDDREITASFVEHCRGSAPSASEAALIDEALTETAGARESA
ncbi:exonuclease SbcCD subunit D [Actinoalloteichus sp. AHMU CJ021]|uniref:Nuclease SbcCD subunit D n=1 Tax=Actinoalloteichus caeruleus DSM 43889 TaxID=1120930 RepID=A0ABT1JJ58_ACTCY|nr:exonuclease SbcCD subunit D [Actinoalloteichus caeruleus]AUS78274.1 exonuclease SbcCD subunit D [Actinoalloteichus sp. AHMU CJ021]MCP2332329.1 Exodeoxyribonuclease I subunit D [Actinoalloteichus caeruleus DSM 43889]